MAKHLWMDTAEEKRFNPMSERRIRVDVAIVGGGVTGITAATLLKRAGKTVALIEMGRVGHGETGHTTAHLTQILDRRYYDLIGRFGRTGARQAAESSGASIDQIEALVREYGIDCGFDRVSAYLYTEKAEEVSELRREMKAMRKIGLSPEAFERAPLPFPTAGAIRLDRQARIHPLKYLTALAERIPGDGSYLFEETRALSIDDGAPCRVRTQQGTILASEIISAADAPASSAYLLQTKVFPYRTYAIGAEITGAEELPLESLFYDTADPYHYIRMQEGVLIVGGEDHRVGMKEDTDESFAALEHYTRRRFAVRDVTYRWSGQVMEPADGLPYIGRSPLAKKVYVATGFSGTGITFGTLSAMILADLILGRENPWTELYDPMRFKPLASAKRFISGNAEYPVCLVKDWVSGGEVSSLSEIGTGEGKLVRTGASKAAVFRDERGKLHAVSAVCPHMGCMVHFNSAERSWDCPCHGSRFGTDGKLLHGPALKDLRPVDLSGLSGTEPLADEPGKKAA